MTNVNVATACVLHHTDEREQTDWKDWQKTTQDGSQYAAFNSETNELKARLPYSNYFLLSLRSFIFLCIKNLRRSIMVFTIQKCAFITISLQRF